MSRHFEFPELAKPGVYVIDFIGNGKNSRAVIRKGQLRYLLRTSTVGHVFTILDEQNQVLKDASLWLTGHEYRAGEDGTIAVPYSTQPGRQPIILSHQGLSTLAWFEHQSEDYQLAAGMYVDREALLSRKTAKLLVRPSLRVNGTPVTLSVLEDIRLTITSTDQDGVATKKEVADFKLAEDREAVYEFQVPPRLSKIQFALTAKVQNLSQNKKVDLAVGEEFQLNGIDKTEEIKDLHLTNFARPVRAGIAREERGATAASGGACDAQTPRFSPASRGRPADDGKRTSYCWAPWETWTNSPQPGP